MSDHHIACTYCHLVLAKFNEQTEEHIPSFKELYCSGKVPVPHFGWFCSQGCATKFEKKYKIYFQRIPLGIVDYYEGEFDCEWN